MLLISSEEVSERMLTTLISVCGDSVVSPLLLREMCRLADAHSGNDHRQLFPAAVFWLSTWSVLALIKYTLYLIKIVQFVSYEPNILKEMIKAIKRLDQIRNLIEYYMSTIIQI